MSTVSISYGSLKDASEEAKAVARKLNGYANSIEKTVYNKLNKYSGDWTSSIYTARNNASSKMSALRTQASRYSTYADNLIDLRDECKRVDKAVRSKVSSLTATFKETHGIRNSKVENTISYFFTTIGNSSGFGRWLGDKADMYRIGTNFLKESIKEWYNYEGGKEAIKGCLVGLLEFGIAVVSVVAAIATFIAGAITFGAVLVLIAGVVAGVIMFANSVENIVNEYRAYNARKNDDPATGRRLSEQNTIQDRLRQGDIGGTDNTLLWIDLNNVSESRKWALGIDIVNFCCTVVTVVNSCGKLLKNGYKWATGSTKELKDITCKDLFSKSTFKDFFGKLKGNLSSSIKQIGASIKSRNVRFVVEGFKDFGSDFLSNLKNSLFSWKSGMNWKDIGKNAKTLKNWFNIGKEFVSEGITIKGVLEKIMLPNISIASITTLSFPKEGGQGFFDFDTIKAKDFYDLRDIKIKIIESDLFKSNQSINIDSSTLDKLSERSQINISIPDIYVPQMTFSASAL